MKNGKTRISTRSDPEDSNQEQQLGHSSSRTRRRKSPGVRIIHGRIYDSQNGKTCHQCRQKTMDFVASCKKKNEDRQCTFNFCHKCLLNRYGENAEEMAVLDDWACPRCRGICNCSFCMKKRGHNPTGKLVHTAKANGFSSVSEMLHLEEPAVVLMMIWGEGNRIKKQINSKSQAEPLKRNGENKKNRSNKFKVFRNNDANHVACKGNMDDDSLTNKCTPKKTKTFKEASRKTAKIYRKDDGGQLTETNSDMKFSKRTSQESIKMEDEEIEGLNNLDSTNATSKRKPSTEFHKCKKKNSVEFMIRGSDIEISSPQGIELNDVAAVDIIAEDVEHALQFLEFCEAFGQEPEIALMGKQGQRNSSDDQNNSKSLATHLNRNSKEMKARSSKLRIFRKSNADDEHKGNGDDDLVSKKSAPKKLQISKEASWKKEMTCSRDVVGQFIKMNFNMMFSERISQKSGNVVEIEEPNNVQVNNDACKPNVELHEFKKKNSVEVKRTGSDVEISLPQGIELNSVAAVDMLAEDVGHALQFLEFCEAFGQVLDLRKGQAELLLQDLACLQSRQRAKDYSIVQFQIQLLSMILQDSRKEYPSSNQTICEYSWLQCLRKYVSETKYPMKKLQFDSFDVDGYDHLDFSKKLKILNFLCDEALGTADLRSWIDEKNSKFVKGEKKKVLADKEKEQTLKKRLHNGMARTMLIENGEPLSTSEHEDLVLKIKSEVAQTISETLEATDMTPKEKHWLGAVRSEPILIDGNSCKFWRLKSYSGNMDFLLQDVGSGDMVTTKERWLIFDIEQKAAVEKYISLRKLKR